MIPRVLPLLSGRVGEWPHAGAFYGLLDDGDPLGPWLAWAGRVGAPARSADDVEQSWRISRVVHRALLRGGLPARERRAAIAAAWGRLDPGLVLPGLGPLGVLEPGELQLLLISGDREGIAIGATGLVRLIAVGTGQVWADGPHPLTAARGLPIRKPGALAVEWSDLRPLPPAWLVGVGPGDAPPEEARALVAAAGAA
jgi:hypothetical protein